MSSSDTTHSDPDFAAHEITYHRFVTVFATVILAHFVGGSFVFVGLFSGGGWIAAVVVAAVEIAVIASVWRLMRKTGTPSRA